MPNWLRAKGLDEADAALRLDRLEIGARYHVYHVLALMVIGLWQRQAGTPVGSSAAWLFVIGILVFSGCLYAYALTGNKVFGMIVPLGGVSFIAGWLALAVAATRDAV